MMFETSGGVFSEVSWELRRNEHFPRRWTSNYDS